MFNLIKSDRLGRLAKILSLGLSLYILAGLLVACGNAVTPTAPTVVPSTTLTAPTAPVTTTAPVASTVAATPTPLSKQPGQPTSGPGGSGDYVYDDFTSQSYGSGGQQYYVFEPGPKQLDKTLPLVILLHGYTDVTPSKYQAWIKHLVRRGHIVVYPVYQASFAERDGSAFTENAFAAIKAAVEELQNGTHARPDLNKVSITGYSAGGVIAINYTARAARLGLPVPKSLLAVTPGGCSNCTALAINNFNLAAASELAEIAPTTKVAVWVGDSDSVVGETTAQILWKAITQITAANKTYVKAITDQHGEPALLANHGMANHVPPDAYNYNGIWKIMDGLESCALSNTLCEYALGDTPQLRSLGKWSDGTPIAELKVTK